MQKLTSHQGQLLFLKAFSNHMSTPTQVLLGICSASM